MDQDNTGEGIEGVVFEDTPQSLPEVAFTPVNEEKRKNLAEFYSPLFHKRFSRTQMYWAAFILVGAFWTVKILFFVHTFAQEINDYQTSMTEDRPQYEKRVKKTPPVLPSGKTAVKQNG